jgi:hypothetical protein
MHPPSLFRLSNMNLRFFSLRLAAMLLALPLSAGAHQDPDFDADAKPILRMQPHLLEYVRENFEVRDVGLARVPGDEDRKPMPPFIFQARPRGTEGAYFITLLIQPGPQGRILKVIDHSQPNGRPPGPGSAAQGPEYGANPPESPEPPSRDQAYAPPQPDIPAPSSRDERYAPEPPPGEQEPDYAPSTSPSAPAQQAPEAPAPQMEPVAPQSPPVPAGPVTQPSEGSQPSQGSQLSQPEQEPSSATPSGPISSATPSGPISSDSQSTRLPPPPDPAPSQ